MSLLWSEHDYTTFTWEIWLDALHHRPQNGRMKHCAAIMPNTSSISSRPVPGDCQRLLPHFYSYKWEMRLSVRVTRPWAELQPGSPGLLPALNFSWNVVKFSRLLMPGQNCKEIFGKKIILKKIIRAHCYPNKPVILPLIRFQETIAQLDDAWRSDAGAATDMSQTPRATAALRTLTQPSLAIFLVRVLR